MNFFQPNIIKKSKEVVALYNFWAKFMLIESRDSISLQTQNLVTYY
jgi:hypothetical protein